VIELRSEFLLLSAGVVWGLTFPVMKIALADLFTFQFLMLRFSIALPIIAALRRTPKIDVLSALVGLISFLGMVLQVTGLRYTTATNSGFITGMYVVFTPVVSYILLGRRPPARLAISLPLSLIGLTLITNYRFEGVNIGDLLTLLSSILWSIQIVLIGICASRTDPLSLAFIQSLIIVLMSSPIALIQGPFDVSASALTALLYTSIFGTVYGLWAQAKGQRDVSPEIAAFAYLLEPVTSALSSYLLLGEVMSTEGLFGSLAILLSIAITMK
jgi:drug/metabolite transporter (DMT)-like permease